VLGYHRGLDGDEYVVLVNFTDQRKRVPLDGAWEVVVDSQAFEGRGKRAGYTGGLAAEQALLLAPAGQRGTL